MGKPSFFGVKLHGD